jgi:hypothetical protein
VAPRPNAAKPPLRAPRVAKAANAAWANVKAGNARAEAVLSLQLASLAARSKKERRNEGTVEFDRTFVFL